jgi:hypothetical protein
MAVGIEYAEGTIQIPANKQQLNIKIQTRKRK